MDDVVLQDMITQGKDCATCDDCVVIRPKAIADKLQGKLSEQDILRASQIMDKQITFSSVMFNLHTACAGLNCSNASKCAFRSIPTGSIDADVMFVSKMPTEYETYIEASHTDVNGLFIALILDKMNVSRHKIYHTDFIKCHTNNLDEHSYNECVQQYFAREVDMVNPKLIICNGLPLLRSCVKSNIFTGLPEAVTYGKIYNAETRSGHHVNIMSIYDLDKVLQKTGDDYEKCKTELWGQLLTGFKSLG